MKKLTAEFCEYLLKDLQRQSITGCGIGRTQECYLQALEIALPILEQQERGEGGFMNQEQMQSEANIYRHDNDEGTRAWFDANAALWTEGYLSPSAFHHIFKPNEAGKWLDSEIRNLEEDGRCTQYYREIREGKTENPVIVVFDAGRAIIWDGFHRISGAVALNKPVYALFATPPEPSTNQNGEQ